MAEQTPVPTNEQGPNEQSIVASGMTVEQWQKLHPGEPVGPDPEDIGQVTTDPPDGSPPPDEASLAMAEYFNPAVGVEGHPARAVAEQQLADAAAARGDTEESGGGQGTANPNAASGAPTPYSNFTSHAQVDGYASTSGVVTPDNWESMTISAKKQWLDENG